MHEVLLDRPEVLKNGLIYLIGIGSTDKAQWNLNRPYLLLAKQLINFVPHRIVAIHHVMAWRMSEYIVPFLLFLLKSEHQHRYKCYSHSPRVFIELAKCGITKDILSVENGGLDKVYNLADWIEYRRSHDL
jgi:hypothetical protein